MRTSNDGGSYYDGSATGSVTVNQQDAPADLMMQGEWWHHIATINVTGGQTWVRVTQNHAMPGETVLVDAAMLVGEGDTAAALGLDPVTVLDDTESATDSHDRGGHWGNIASGYDPEGDSPPTALSHRSSDVANNVPSIANWYRDNLLPGEYRVSVTWPGNTSITLSGDARYRIYDGIEQIGDVRLDQSQEPNDFWEIQNHQIVNWEDLGVFPLVNDRLRVELYDANNDTEMVIADAIRIERLTDTAAVVEYTWDHRNRLTDVDFKDKYDWANGTDDPTAVVTRSVDYFYDVFDRLVLRMVDDDGVGPTTVDRTGYTHDDDHEALLWADDGTGNMVPERRNLYADQIDQLLAQETLEYSSGSGAGAGVRPCVRCSGGVS